MVFGTEPDSLGRGLLGRDILFAPEGENKRGLLIFLWCVYALATGFLISNHTPWQDEAYVWLIAREVNWLNIYKEAGSSTAPSLWYYILAIPAKLGFPYWTMQFLHWLGACLAAWIFLFKAPFSYLFKAAFLFSYYVAYEHAAVSRVYMLTLVFMWGACWCYTKRYERPILYACVLALLAHTSLFGLIAATLLGFEFVFCRESPLTNRQWGAIGCVFASALLSGAGFFLDPFTASWCVVRLNKPFSLGNLKDMFFSAYFSPQAEVYLSNEVQYGVQAMAPWLGALYGAMVLWLLKKWRAYGLMTFFVLSVSVIIYLVIFKYTTLRPRHYSFYLFYAIMVLWLGKVRVGAVKTWLESLIGIVLVSAFLWGALGTIAQAWADARLPFSGGRHMANYLIKHKLDDKIFVVQQRFPAFSVLPYVLKASFWDPTSLTIVRYYHEWGPPRAIRIKKVLAIIDKKYPFSGPVYLLATERVTPTDAGRLKLLYKTSAQKEVLRLYQVAPLKRSRREGL